MVHELGDALLLAEVFIWLEGDSGEAPGVGFFERLGAFVFAEVVEGAVPADGEEPGLEVVLDSGGILLAEADEGVLDDVAGEVEVLEESKGEADE